MIPPVLYIPILVFLLVGLGAAALIYFILSFKVKRWINIMVSFVGAWVVILMLADYVCLPPEKIFSNRFSSSFWKKIRQSEKFKGELKKAQEAVAMPRLGTKRNQTVGFSEVDPYVDKLGENFISKGGNVGLVVGIVQNGQQRVFCYGTTRKSWQNKPDENTVFEIGETSQFFSGFLLAQMHQRAELDIRDFIAPLMPPSAYISGNAEKKLRLADLATHTSGIAPDSGSIWYYLGFFTDLHHPCKRFTEKSLYQFLRKVPVSGKHFEFADVEFALLGNLLERKAGKGYEELLASRIFKPLGMDNTGIVLTDNLKRRMAEGHDFGKKVPYLDVDPHAAGAGGIKTSVHDMLLFLSACAEGSSEKIPDIGPTIGMMLSNRRQAELRNATVGLGCFINRNRQGKDVVVSNGGTEGFKSFMSFSQDARLGVIVLSNSTRYLNYSHIADVFVEDNRVEQIGRRIMGLLSANREAEEN